jgi:SAM-dependent methyltransferase
METESSQPNRAEVEYWNGPGAQRWLAEQARLDHALGPLEEPALERAAPQPGEQVVEVGCGCGASSLVLAERVGPRGSVRAFDVSKPMLERARERARAFPWLTFTAADAATFAFDGRADLLYSRFGVMFFDAPEAAFANLRRALRPSGRLCFLCWRVVEDNPWYAEPMQAAARVVGAPPTTVADAPGPFALAARDRVERILRTAGFTGVDVEASSKTMRLSTTGLDAAVDFAVSAGPVSRILLDVDPETRKRVRASIEDTLRPHVVGQTVALGTGTWVVTARA